MKKISLGIVLLFLISILSGCANIKDDSTRTKVEGAGTGAAVGAVAGGLLGQIFGGDTKSTLVGAAIGATVGGVGGYAYGSHVASQKEKYAKEEDWLEACIAEARRRNQEILVYNQDLANQIAVLQKDTKALKKQYKNMQTRNAKLKEKKVEVEKAIESANKELATSKAELEAQNTVVADARKSGQNDYAQTLDSEMETLKANIKELEKRTEELASMSASMSV